jgi:release factor glutamine methyltransferase
MEEVWTILRVLQWTADYFKRKGLLQPRTDAEVLLAHALKVERIQLYLRYDQPLGGVELDQFRSFVKRRAAREPVQYITGRQEFWSLELEVTPATLVPRPETEILVEKTLELAHGRSARILDLGTGSGAIAIALAHEAPEFELVATDRSMDALRVARRNAVRHNLDHRISFVAMDLFSAFRPTLQPFHLIVSNPPYIGDLELSMLPPEVGTYEPIGALRGGGPQGTELITSIIDTTPSFLRSGGHLLLEIGKGQEKFLMSLLSSKSGIASFEFFKDYSGILRVLHVQMNER